MRDHRDLLGALDFVDPARLSYQEWLEVGLSLHDVGLPMGAWDAWSRRDPARYHEGECERKWAGFGGGMGRHVSSGTLAAMAMEAGWPPSGPDEPLGWDSEVSLADPAWVDDAAPEDEAPDRTPAQMLSDWLAAVFDDGERVGYVCESWETPDGRRVPTKGHSDRTAGQLRQELASCGGDIAKVLGDWDAEVGAWARINPLDGRGVGNANVTEYRHALVESASLPYERQLPMIRAMRLPCAAIVTSGGKSVHAIVRVDAGTDYDLYRKRVEELYAFCRRQGFEPDTQNKNPSRLSRLPGATRGGRLQALVDVDCGCSSWDEWVAWRDEQEDDLPADSADDWDEPIRLAPPLVGTEGQGVLRQGQKMVLAGPSKAGKSFALIDLAEAIACGGSWLGLPCAMGPVYYVNLEIADESFRMRQHVVWDDRVAHGDAGAGLEAMRRNFVRLDLRGHAQDMERLAPLLSRRVLRRGPRGSFMAVVIDPIYKVNGGDENDAAAISRFTNQLDRVASECGCAVIYAHHHAKGAMGARKAMDRMSGSGVFARDADAILDMTQIRVPEDRARSALGDATAWRVTATLREFRSPEPMDLLFKFPRFYRDATGELSRYDVEGENPVREAIDARKEKARAYQSERVSMMQDALRRCWADGVPATRRAVLERINEGRDELDAVTLTQLSNWTTSKAEWSPFRCSGKEHGSVMYDIREEDPWGDEQTL